MGIESISDRVSRRMVKRAIIPASKADRVAYGLALFLSGGIVTVAIMAIALATKTFWLFAVYAAVFWSMRSVFHLYHCNAFYKCFFLSVGLYSVMTFSYLLTASDLATLVWLYLAGLLLAYKAMEVYGITEKNTDKQLFKYFVSACVVGMAVVYLLTLAGARQISFPISYGIFVSSLLYLPTSCLKEKQP